MISHQCDYKPFHVCVCGTGGSVGVGTPVGSYRDKSMSMTPLTSRVSADMTSEGSSTSDEERRRSGSVEGHHQSPDHLRGSMVSKLRIHLPNWTPYP